MKRSLASSMVLSMVPSIALLHIGERDDALHDRRAAHAVLVPHVRVAPGVEQLPHNLVVAPRRGDAQRAHAVGSEAVEVGRIQVN